MSTITRTELESRAMVRLEKALQNGACIRAEMNSGLYIFSLVYWLEDGDCEASNGASTDFLKALNMALDGMKVED